MSFPKCRMVLLLMQEIRRGGNGLLNPVFVLLGTCLQSKERQNSCSSILWPLIGIKASQGAPGTFWQDSWGLLWPWLFWGNKYLKITWQPPSVCSRSRKDLHRGSRWAGQSWPLTGRSTRFTASWHFSIHLVQCFTLAKKKKNWCSVS